MNAAQMQALEAALDQDELDCHKMRSTGAKTETISSATGKVLAAGISLKAIFAAIMTALMTGGGVQGIIAAILALLTPAAPPAP